MKTKRFIVLGFALVAMVLLLTVLALVRASKPFPQSRRLPDGSVLEIVAASYGRTHSYTMPELKPWKKFLLAHSPSFVTARLDWWPHIASVSSSSPPGVADLAVFTISDRYGSGGFKASPKFLLLDEQGNIWDSASVAGESADFAPNHQWKLVCWKFSKIPSDAPRLKLAYSELPADGKERRTLAEFFIPNPRGDDERSSMEILLHRARPQ